MSKDQMQDVFPIVFDFKKGEQPTAAKLTGLVTFTDSAFSRVTQAIGDPWDASSHLADLSIDKLGQSSIARVMGPSSYSGPLGGCWNEQMSTDVTVVLRRDRNSWTLGYPLVKVTSTIKENSKPVTSYVTPLTWGTDIVTDGNAALTTRKTSIEEVVDDGDFYVDFYTGTITAYTSSSIDITITISDLYMLGAGVPWGTHNVIPTWEEEAALCNLSESSSTPTTTTYILTLPTVSASPRYNTATLRTGRKSEQVSDYDSQWSTGVPGSSSNYRLPQALTTGYTSGQEIPEGYILLYYETDGRVLPSTVYTLYYRDANSLTVVTAKDYLTEGANYRILTSGTSLSEAVSHLLQVQRNNNHVGLTSNPTISYTMPLSHDSMDNLYASGLDPTATSAYRLKFTKSNYETNCHPQYLHRYGWMENDVPSDASKKGNSGNAMRGNLVFSGNDSNMYVGTGGSSGNWTATYGIMWGGGSTDSTSGNTSLSFQGGEGISTWTSGTPDRFVFCSDYTGGSSSTLYGALTYVPWMGTPLYLRGRNTTNARDGAMLGFDLRRQGEFNYIKLFEGYRTTVDPAHQCANTGQTATSALFITPSLSGASFERIAAEQVREFRFRGVPYISSATNTGNSLGDSLGKSEFNHSFVSPGMVGADFFNVYSNAIFFSDDGDGSRTSFTEHGKNWLDVGTSTYMPSGIYFIPHNGSESARFVFNTQEDSTTASGDDILHVGSAHGLRYYGERLDLITRNTTNFAGYAFPIDTFVTTTLKGALWNYQNLVMDATEDKNVGILSYDGRIDLQAVNTYQSASGSSAPRHINIYTTTLGTVGGRECGNITLHAGYDYLGAFGSVATSNGSVLYLKAYNNVEVESEGKDVNITSTLGDINIDATGDTYVNSSDFTKITTDGSAGKIEISTASTTDSSESGDISIEAAGSQGRIYLSSASLHNIDVSSNNALTMRAFSYISLGTNVSESHITNASNYATDTITLSSRSNKTNTGTTGKILLDSVSDVHLYADDDILIDATDDMYMTVGGDVTLENTGTIYVHNITADAGSGGVRYDPVSNEITYLASSLRYKENVFDIQDTSWIYDLRPVSFNYIGRDKTNYGLIAEEAINYNTDIVSLDKHGRPESILYESVFTALLNEVKNQKKEIDSLKAQLAGK